MANELINQQIMPLAAPSLEQTGKNNVNVTNQQGGIVNLNYNIHLGETVDSSEKMMAIQKFSKKYYQLLVTTEEDVFVNNIVTISADRALSQYYVPPEILERCSSLSDEGIEELKTFPAIVCRENTDYNGETDPNQMAMYCYIKLVKKEGKNIKVAFRPIAPFFQIKLCEVKTAVYFDLRMDCAITDLNHSAWSVHKVNLFEAFKEAGIPNMPCPL